MGRHYYEKLKPAVSKKTCQFLFLTDRPMLVLSNLSKILIEKRIRTELLRMDMGASGDGEIYLACDIDKELVKDMTQLFYRTEGVRKANFLDEWGREDEEKHFNGYLRKHT